MAAFPVRLRKNDLCTSREKQVFLHPGPASVATLGATSHFLVFPFSEMLSLISIAWGTATAWMMLLLNARVSVSYPCIIVLYYCLTVAMQLRSRSSYATPFHMLVWLLVEPITLHLYSCTGKLQLSYHLLERQ